ncbi:MAG: hypothetical protein M3P43_02165 [Actinomycetota bacterium]|nr:hypothetical protein [Actinomycetota bacterium]
MLASSAYAAAGDLDPTFGVGGRVTTDFTRRWDFAYSIVLQDDGKIVTAGEAGAGGSNPRFALARYDTDGTLDTSFGGDGRLTTDFTTHEDLVYALAIQGDGKIVAAGTAGQDTSNSKFALARYNTDGTLDTSFGGDGKLMTSFDRHAELAFAMTIQDDSKIVVVGDAGGGGSRETFAVARYETDGSLDTSFGGDGKVRTDLSPRTDDALAVAIQGHGKIVVAGGAGAFTRHENFTLVRYDADGSLDGTFGGDGKVTTSFTRRPDVPFAIAIQANGKIVVVGGARQGARNSKWALARYDADGTLDTTFSGDGRAITDFTRRDDGAYSVAIQADGKIVAAGLSGFGTANAKFGLVRYETDGTLDGSFDTDGKVTTDFTTRADSAWTVAIQADGRIVAVGQAGKRFALARYLAA